jgi:hypothetical protein
MSIWRNASFPVFLVGFLCLCLLDVCAQEDDAPVPPARDYSAGFRKLMSVGLPDLAAATYVQLAVHSSYVRTGSYDEVSSTREGNAWLLAEAEGLGTFLMTTDWSTVTVRRAGEDNEGVSAVAGPLVGSWTAADPADDAEKTMVLLTRFVEQSDNEDAQQRMVLGPFRGTVNSAAELLFATSVFAHGDVARANRLTDILFTAAPDARALLTGALSTIFDGQYLTLVRRFIASPDWQAFHDGLRDLLSRGEGVWRHSDTAATILEQVARHLRAASDGASDGSLTAQQQDAARAFLADLTVHGTGSGLLRNCGLWILLPPPHAVHGSGSDALLHLLSLRRGALPILVAWVEDEGLLPVFPGSTRTPQGIDWDSSLPPEAVYGYSASSGLPTPCSRRDLASVLLSSLRFRGDGFGGLMEGGFGGAGREIDRAEAESLAKDIAATEDRALALRYLREGDSRQINQAASFLLIDASEAEVDAVCQATMETMRADAMPHIGLNIVRLLIREHQERAKTLLDRIEQDFGTEEYIQSHIKLLRRSLEPKSPSEAPLEELLKSIAKGGETTAHGESLQTTLIPACRGRSREDILRAFLDAAAGADDKAAISILSCYGMCDRAAHGDDDAYAAEDDSALLTWDNIFERRQKAAEFQRRETKPPTPEDVRKGLALVRSCTRLFRELLVRKGTGGDVTWGPVPYTVGDIAARMVVTIAACGAEQFYASAAGCLEQLPDEGRRWIRRVATQLVAGDIDAIPPLPDPASVGAERREELSTELSALTGAELSARLLSLSDAELLAINEMVGKGESPALAKVLAKSARYVSTATCTLEKDGLKTTLAGVIGKPVDRQLVETLVQAVKTCMTDTGESCVCSVYPRQGGTVVLLATSPRLGRMFGRDRDMPAMVHATFAAGRDRAETTWPVESDSEAARPQETDLDAKLRRGAGFLVDFGRGEEEFWEKLDVFGKSDTPPAPDAMLIIQGIVPVAEPKTDE